MPKKLHEIEDLAQAFRAEIEEDAAAIAGQAASELLADTLKVSKPAFLSHVRRQWLTDPEYPQTLMDKLAPKGPTGQRPQSGLRAFVSVAKDAFAQQDAPDETDPVVQAATAVIAQEPALEPTPADMAVQQYDAAALEGG